MISALARAWRNDDGSAIVEYALVLAGITLSSIVALQALGAAINSLYANLADQWAGSAQSGL